MLLVSDTFIGPMAPNTAIVCKHSLCSSSSAPRYLVSIQETDTRVKFVAGDSSKVTIFKSTGSSGKDPASGFRRWSLIRM